MIQFGKAINFNSFIEDVMDVIFNTSSMDLLEVG